MPPPVPQLCHSSFLNLNSGEGWTILGVLCLHQPGSEWVCSQDGSYLSHHNHSQSHLTVRWSGAYAAKRGGGPTFSAQLLSRCWTFTVSWRLACFSLDTCCSERVFTDRIIPANGFRGQKGNEAFELSP